MRRNRSPYRALGVAVITALIAGTIERFKARDRDSGKA
jgi:hypothetical protein